MLKFARELLQSFQALQNNPAALLTLVCLAALGFGGFCMFVVLKLAGK